MMATTQPGGVCCTPNTTNAERPRQMPPKNWTEFITALLAVLGALGTFIALVYRHFRRVEQLEMECRELHNELSELKGTVKAHSDSLTTISASLAGITARLDMLIGRPERGKT